MKTLFGEDVTLGGKITFCYLDGDHSYDQVKKDYLNIDKILDTGGFIYFDDSDELHRDAGVVKNGCFEVVCEAINTSHYQVALKYPNYLLQKIG